MTARKTPLALAAAFALAAALPGCSAEEKGLYHWGSYPDQVYAYFNDEPVGALIDAMEEQRREAAGGARPLPPSFHAHLGLLYQLNGDAERFRELLRVERDLYPESAGLVEFFLNRPG